MPVGLLLAAALSGGMMPFLHSAPSEKEQIERILDRYEQCGFGGCVVAAESEGDYLGPKAWEPFRAVVRSARSRGLRLWLYDEHGYPSGSCDGRVLADHPEWQARGLFVAVTDVNAGQDVELEVPPGRFLRAIACPVESGRVDAERIRRLDVTADSGRIRWHASGDSQAWRLMAVAEGPILDGSPAANTVAAPRPFVNMLDREPVERFLALTHELYAQNLKGDLSSVEATFSDEASLMSLWTRPMPYYVLPTSGSFSGEYRARTGRDVLDDVPILVCPDARGRAAACRHAFWKLVGDRVSACYFKTIAEWTARHGLMSGGHLFFEEGISGHAALYGDFFKCLRSLTAPGCDCLTSLPDEVPYLTALMAGSAGALNDAAHVMCEVSDHRQRFRRSGDSRPVHDVSESEIRGTLNRLLWGGVDTFTSYYVLLDRFPEWQIRRMNLRLSRCAKAIGETHDESGLALLYPSDALMSTFAPGLHWGGGRDNAQVARSFTSAGEALFKSNLPFMIADAAALAESSVDAKSASLVHGKLRWKLVVLPSAVTLPLEVMQKLHEFVRSGGVVLATGSLPANSTEAFPSSGIRDLGRDVFPAGAVSDSRIVEVAERTCGRGYALRSGDAAPLRTARRRAADGSEVLFVFNDSPSDWSGALSFAKGTTVRMLDAESGEKRIYEGETVSLPPYGELLFKIEPREGGEDALR